MEQDLETITAGLTGFPDLAAKAQRILDLPEAAV